MKKIVLFAFITFTVYCMGQEPSDTIGITRPLNTSVFFENGASNSHNNSQLPLHPHFGLNSFSELPPFDIPAFRTVNFPSFKGTFIPFVLPTDNLFGQFALDNRSWINTAHISNNYFGLGGMTLLNATYNRRIGDFIVLGGGVYTSKFNAYNNFYNSTGLNGNIKLRLNERISINMRGQYSVTDNKTPLPGVSSMYPQSYYGGSFEFKVTEKWGIITGADREFDVMQHKWVTRPYILPVFYGK